MVKRVISILMTITMIFSLAACGQTTANENNEADGKTLIVYFSWSASGNTEKMASYIQEQTNGDLLEIEPLNPYPTDYEECGDVALVERDENARPEIANLPDSIEEYDTIFIGYAGGIIGLN